MEANLNYSSIHVVSLQARHTKFYVVKPKFSNPDISVRLSGCVITAKLSKLVLTLQIGNTM